MKGTPQHTPVSPSSSPSSSLFRTSLSLRGYPHHGLIRDNLLHTGVSTHSHTAEVYPIQEMWGSAKEESPVFLMEWVIFVYFNESLCLPCLWSTSLPRESHSLPPIRGGEKEGRCVSSPWCLPEFRLTEPTLQGNRPAAEEETDFTWVLSDTWITKTLGLHLMWVFRRGMVFSMGLLSSSLEWGFDNWLPGGTLLLNQSAYFWVGFFLFVQLFTTSSFYTLPVLPKTQALSWESGTSHNDQCSTRQQCTLRKGIRNIANSSHLKKASGNFLSASWVCVIYRSP